MTSPRAVCVGEGLVVLVAEPGALEDSATFQRSAGGAEANVARVLVQLGVTASWVSRVGDDGFGRYLTRQLADAGVDTSAVHIDAERPTGMYVKQRGAGTPAEGDLPMGDSAMTYFRAGSAASAMSTSDAAEGPAADLLRQANIVHFSGITVALSNTAEALTRSLLDFDGIVSFDLNFRPSLWKNRPADAATVLADHVRGSDVVFMGADEAADVFGVDDPSALRARFPEPRHLVVKNDAHVVTAYDGDLRVDVPALTLDVFEKIGAGDAFAGGFLAGIARGATAVERVRLGHLCAAAALTAHGDAAEVLGDSRLTAALRHSDSDWSTLRYSDVAAS
ncbi:MAG: sugar kinase [Rhodococcus sp. (in: high G+C Gram-positive bacteria)]